MMRYSTIRHHRVPRWAHTRDLRRRKFKPPSLWTGLIARAALLAAGVIAVAVALPGTSSPLAYSYRGGWDARATAVGLVISAGQAQAAELRVEYKSIGEGQWQALIRTSVTFAGSGATRAALWDPDVPLSSCAADQRLPAAPGSNDDPGAGTGSAVSIGSDGMTGAIPLQPMELRGYPPSRRILALTCEVKPNVLISQSGPLIQLAAPGMSINWEPSSSKMPPLSKPERACVEFKPPSTTADFPALTPTAPTSDCIVEKVDPEVFQSPYWGSTYSPVKQQRRESSILWAGVFIGLTASLSIAIVEDDGAH